MVKINSNIRIRGAFMFDKYKLNIKDLNSINLDINVLNRITIDEYNILKNYLNKRGINI